MDAKAWVALVGLVVTIVGWFVSENRKRRTTARVRGFENRMNALNLAVRMISFVDNNGAPFTDPNFLPLLEETRRNFQLYCRKDEVDNLEEFINAIDERSIIRANYALNDLRRLVADRIREGAYVE